MSRFNSPKVSVMNKKIVNFAGGLSYKESDKVELVSVLLTSFVKDQFYRKSDNVIERIKELVGKVDPFFAAKAAVYARNEFGMRTVTHIVAGEIANNVKGKDWTKRFFDRVVYRVDDATEILSYYMKNYGKPIPNSLKKGLSLALGHFDSYSLSKYRSENKELKLVDLVNLIHPKPTNNNSNALKELVNSTLKSSDTWETKLSEAGKAETEEEVSELKAEAWRELVRTKKLGYFAALRNLRNLLTQAPDVVDNVLEFLINEKAMRNSKVLPFRFNTTIQELQKNDVPSRVIAKLSEALDMSVANIPILPGKTLVVIDHSGSMSSNNVDEISALFGAAIFKSQKDSEIMVFSDNAKYLRLNPTDSVSTLMEKILSGLEMAGTNFHAIFETANKAYDRIFILSDMQGWIGHDTPELEYKQYKIKYNTNPIIYSWNMNDYGTLQFPENNVYLLAGWSEKIFDVLSILEQDKKALINKIENIEI